MELHRITYKSLLSLAMKNRNEPYPRRRKNILEYLVMRCTFDSARIVRLKVRRALKYMPPSVLGRTITMQKYGETFRDSCHFAIKRDRSGSRSRNVAKRNLSPTPERRLDPVTVAFLYDVYIIDKGLRMILERLETAIVRQKEGLPLFVEEMPPIDSVLEIDRSILDMGFDYFPDGSSGSKNDKPATESKE